MAGQNALTVLSCALAKVMQGISGEVFKDFFMATVRNLPGKVLLEKGQGNFFMDKVSSKTKETIFWGISSRGGTPRKT